MSIDVPERWQRPIFVASMGRSGSTLLQRVLNVHPDITIWGEHAGFLTGIFQSMEAVQADGAAGNLNDGFEHRASVIGELSETAVFKPWVSPFAADGISDSIRSFVIDLFTKDLTPEMRWGFKEIRYTDAELRVLLGMFPQAHLILLGRDLSGYAQSRFFAFGNTTFDFETDDGLAKATRRLQNVSNGWIKRYQGLVELQAEHADRSSIVAYNDLTLGSPRPQRLFEELGEPPARPETLDAVLSAVAGSSYKHNSSARAGKQKVSELVAELDIDWQEVDRLSTILGLS